MQDRETTVAMLREQVEAFVTERAWGPFHHPKELAISLSIEAAELLERFQWSGMRPVAEIRADAGLMQDLADEMADVLAHLLNMANVLDIDLAAAFTAKMAQNAAKYPVDLAKGSAAKYTDLADRTR